MSLRNYKPQITSIPLDDGSSLVVRALGLADFQHLIVNRGGLVDSALGLFGADGFDAASASPEQMQGFAAKLLGALPGLAGELIAIASNEPDCGEQAMQLPAPVQMQALVSVYEMTFREPGSLGKFFGHLTSMMTAIPRSKTMTVAASVSGGSNNFGAMSAS